MDNFHPNGQPMLLNLKRPQRDDEPIYDDIFPKTDLGDILRGLLVFYLNKQEPRLGWARKSACSESDLLLHPNETVAAHQWGVCTIVMIVSFHPKFKDELPEFDCGKAMAMAMVHDVAEVVTGDITPVDGISPEEKHKLEKEAMTTILGLFPKTIEENLHKTYTAYEDRKCNESKLVKDADKLDFMINAFLLERQGFSGFHEFYPNSIKQGFSTIFAQELADTLIQTREDLLAKGLLYKKPEC